MLPVITIGSLRGIRFLDSYKSYPADLKQIDGNESALDWNIASLKKAGSGIITYIGGYHMEKVVQQHADLHYVFHSNWEKEGSVKALFCAEKLLLGGGLIIDSKVVFNSEAVMSLMKEAGEIVLGVEPVGKDISFMDGERLLIHPSKTSAPFRFTGMVKCTASGARVLLEKAEKLVERNVKAELCELICSMYAEHNSIQVVNLSGKWSPLDQPMALSQFVFGTKALTLERLQSVLKKCSVLDQVRFTVKEWMADKDKIFEDIYTKLKGKYLIVRSSALVEDAWLESNAGRFRSVLNVDAASRESIATAIDQVIDSYWENGDKNTLNQVFVQPHVDEVAISGVMFTRDLETQAPYYTINYHSSHKTDSVTAGNEPEIKTLIVYKNGEYSALNKEFSALIEMGREIEFLMGSDSLDIEFAISKTCQIYLLQVRPITTKKREFVPMDEDFNLEIKEAEEFVGHIFQPATNLLGHSTILSNMSDWNPAEMIGVNPRPLALSLYQYIITDRVWSDARSAAGYRDTYPSPLLFVVSGQPYIDLRASFNSFIPANVSESLAEKCVNGYIKYLTEHAELHDKVEFEVAVTCMTFDFEEHAKRLSFLGLSSSEIEELKSHLIDLTDQLILQKRAPTAEQLDALEVLDQRRKSILLLQDNKSTIPVKVRQVLDDCVRYGTLPFSILARNGFIALSLLRSLRNKCILNQDEYEKCLHIPTIATEISNSLKSVIMGNSSRVEFLKKYGHLRPGTYDILSPNYRQAADNYLNLESIKTTETNECASEQVASDILEKKFPQIDIVLKEYGFRCSAWQMRDFIFASIKGREYAKFEFTKNVNLVLECISELGKHWGLDNDQLSYLSINDILRWATDSQHCAMYSRLERIIKFEEKRHILNRSVKLPFMILSPVDIDCFEVIEGKSNFITSETICAEVILLEEHADKPQNLQGKIVAIKNADPGFDWIFAHCIAGLVTQYGGAASHMAIRAAEFGLPAAIGCGEIIFKRVCNANVILLDCVGQQIKSIN